MKHPRQEDRRMASKAPAQSAAPSRVVRPNRELDRTPATDAAEWNESFKLTAETVRRGAKLRRKKS